MKNKLKHLESNLLSMLIRQDINQCLIDKPMARNQSADIDCRQFIVIRHIEWMAGYLARC